jgi:hypothetical protein
MCLCLPLIIQYGWLRKNKKLGRAEGGEGKAFTRKYQ